MVRTTIRTARKPYRCGCGATIRTGDAHYEHVISPNHSDAGNSRWLRTRECGWCASRYGRSFQ